MVNERPTQTRTRHWLSRELPGQWVMLPLPLCWDADEQAKPEPGPDELWWLAWDHDAIDPAALVFATTREAVDCRDCLAWLHA